VNHRAPSSIGIGTVYCSTGRIPEVFLRGAAASEHLITYVGSLLGETNRFYACFISYSSKHQAFAERQHADLRSKGMRCWFPPENMTTRDEMAPCLHTAIGEHDKLLVVLSAHSIGSDWVKHEVDAALDQEREQNRTGLFSVRLDDAAMGIQVGWPAIIRNSRYIGDFRQWKDGDAYQKALGRLLRDLEAE